MQHSHLFCSTLIVPGPGSDDKMKARIVIIFTRHVHFVMRDGESSVCAASYSTEYC